MFGVLAIDKPAGLTSRDVVNRVQRLVRPVKVGHTGTLDPLATGVLLLALGSATRLVEFSHASRKSYVGEFDLGCRSETLDIEGQVSELERAPIPSLRALESECQKWIGAVKQIPPKFSAINIGGKRAYDLARDGKDFELQARDVHIESIKILDYAYPRLRLDIYCGSGTYIRSLGSDIARGLGSDAIMTSLVRTSIGSVNLADCQPMDAMASVDDVAGNLLPATTLLSEMKFVSISESAAKQIRNGIPLASDQVPGLDDSSELAACTEAGELVAIIERSGEHYRSRRVFQKTNDTSQPSSNSRPQSPES